MTVSGSYSVFLYTNIKITSSLPHQLLSSESDVFGLQVLWGLWQYLQSAVHCLCLGNEDFVSHMPTGLAAIF
jgi:hypothetical protein